MSGRGECLLPCSHQSTYHMWHIREQDQRKLCILNYHRKILSEFILKSLNFCAINSIVIVMFVQVWDVKTMEQVAELTGHVGIIYSLQVIEAPSGGTRLFSACYDKTLRVSLFPLLFLGQISVLVFSLLIIHILFDHIKGKTYLKAWWAPIIISYHYQPSKL